MIKKMRSGALSPFWGLAQTPILQTITPHRQLVDTTVELANKVGAAEIVVRVVDDLKDEVGGFVPSLGASPDPNTKL